MNVRNIYAVFGLLTLLFSVLLCSACQKPETERPHEQVTAKAVENPQPDLNVLCNDLKAEMQNMTAERTTFALEQMNQNIRLCLPLISLAEKQVLMNLSAQMYQQFLTVQRNPEQQTAFDHYALDESQFPTIQQSHFEKLHIRDQYLLRHKGQAYIDVDDRDPLHVSYRRNILYLARVFAPYFPAAEQQFIQQLAEQNQQPAFKNQMILLTAQQLTDRALYWEHYLKQYPNSQFKNDAKLLYQHYQSLLFFGLADSPVSLQYEGRLDISANHLTVIEQLATLHDTALAQKAQLFLKFIDLNTEQRNQLLNANSTVAQQLAQYLKVPIFNPKNSKQRDCFNDAICH